VRQLGLALLLLLTASIATLAVHRQTLSYGFDYDDYHFVHPYSRADVLRAFHAPWDAAGIERPYYRPLTIAFYAARFEIFGINATAQHTLSLVLFGAAATLAGWFVLRLSGSAAMALLTVLFYVVHPAMPYSLVAWVTNQMHLIESLVLLAALIWWDAVRNRSVGWWLPLLGFAGAAFLIKEDGIMLVPGILVLHATRRRVGDEPLSPAPRSFIVASGVLLLLLIAIRALALSSAPPIRSPSIELALHNYFHGLNGVLRLVPADRRWQLAASWFASVAPVAAMLMWRRLSPGARLTLLSGLALALLFNVPFVFITKAEQMHVVALGAVLVLAAACAGLIEATRRRDIRSIVLAAWAVGIVCLGAVARDIARDFEPYGPVVRAHDEMVRGWMAVPLELREYLTRKNSLPGARPLPADPSMALDVVSFGVHEPERSGEGIAYRWMAGQRMEMLVTDRARTVMIPLRHAIEVFRQPTRARITADGHLVDDILFDTSEWRMSATALPLIRAPRLARMHRIVVEIDHDWSPAEVIPGSQDGRTLGLQVRALQMR
jgi:hypothetical protein